MKRQTLIRELTEAIGNARLIWFGTRGDDVEAAADLPQLTAAFSIIGAYRQRSSVEAMAYEDLTGLRVDLDAYDIDDDLATETMREFRSAMLRALAHPSVVFVYRPSVLVSAVCFARRDRCRYLGLFRDHQVAFEHKPWVETEIADLGVPHVPWSYVADEDQLDTLRFLGEGPVILRRSHSSGGAGLVRVDDALSLRCAWPYQDEAYVSVAPFLTDTIPLNVGAVAWNDGVTIHPASVQLVGVDSCTNREFGYCGNDFGIVADFDPEVLDAVEASVMTVGNWLRAFGYRGAFGVDFLIQDGVPLFMEVNPRFQGSTHASCQISVDHDESCLMLEHLAACSGRDAPPTSRLRDLAARTVAFAHFVVHWKGDPTGGIDGERVARNAFALPDTVRADVLTNSKLTTDLGATIARITTRARVTRTGAELLDSWLDVAKSALPDARAQCVGPEPT